MQCVHFPVRRSISAVFYTTNVLFAPIIYGVGIVGNLLAILILNRRYLRKDSAVYVYLSAIAVVDMLALLIRIPGSIRDLEVLPINITYSKSFSYASWFSYGADFVFRNASTWLLVFLCIVRYISARWPFSQRRFTRISSSRITVFIIFMFCSMINFPRFFEVSAMEVKGHCFPGLQLWTENRTSFSRREGYSFIYPWLTVTVCYFAPLCLLVIFLCLLGFYSGWSNFTPSKVMKMALRKPKNEDQRELQITITVFVIVLSFIILESPNLLKHVLLAALGHDLDRHQIFYEYSLISNCLSLVHCVLNFIFLSIYNHDFRKTFTRTFCCLCGSCLADEYYEGIRCCPCCRKAEEDPVFKEKKSLDVVDDGPVSNHYLLEEPEVKKSFEAEEEEEEGDETDQLREMKDGWI